MKRRHRDSENAIFSNPETLQVRLQNLIGWRQHERSRKRKDRFGLLLLPQQKESVLPVNIGFEREQANVGAMKLLCSILTPSRFCRVGVTNNI